MKTTEVTADHLKAIDAEGYSNDRAGCWCSRTESNVCLADDCKPSRYATNGAVVHMVPIPSKPTNWVEADRAICDAATSGPWHEPNCDGTVRENKAYGELLLNHGLFNRNRKNDVKFAIAAREGWPKALDEIERLRGLFLEVSGAEVATDIEGAIDRLEATYTKFRAYVSRIFDREGL